MFAVGFEMREMDCDVSRVARGRSDAVYDRRELYSDRVGATPRAVKVWVRIIRTLVWFVRDELSPRLEDWVPLRGLVFPKSGGRADGSGSNGTCIAEHWNGLRSLRCLPWLDLGRGDVDLGVYFSGLLEVLCFSFSLLGEKRWRRRPSAATGPRAGSLFSLASPCPWPVSPPSLEEPPDYRSTPQVPPSPGGGLRLPRLPGVPRSDPCHACSVIG